MQKEITNQPDWKSISMLSGIITTFSCIGWMLSAVVHELGHAFAVLVNGGTVTEIQPWVLVGAPHTAFVGNFSTEQNAVIAVAGAALVYLIGILFFSLFPFRKSNPYLTIAVTFGILPFVAQSISYIILPILFVFGASIRDDVINFLAYSGLSPLIVSCTASLLAISAGLIIYKRTNVLISIQQVVPSK